MLPDGYSFGKVWRRERDSNPRWGYPQTVSSNWTQKRDRRDSEGVLRSDVGVSRNPEAVERICGSTQPSTQKQHRPNSRCLVGQFFAFCEESHSRPP